jgi:hypothetical protein
MSAESYLKAAGQTRIVARVIELGRWLAAPPRGPVTHPVAGWFAGLSVDADSFTYDLSHLQDALRAPTPAPEFSDAGKTSSR